MSQKQSGQNQFVFEHQPDLHTLPSDVQDAEVNLHGSFAVDQREGFGHIYYWMPGYGIMRIDADLKKQELIAVPDHLRQVNFHSTRIYDIDGHRRLILTANNDELVAIVTLDGHVDFTLSRPSFAEYESTDMPYKPTDTILVDDQLYITDGYGANYVTSVNVNTREWINIFGGKTEDPDENGKFGTAHGINRTYSQSGHEECLVIVDRPYARLQLHRFDGTFVESHQTPEGSWPCGIDFTVYEGRTYALIGSLRDPVEDRPAPIYILDADTFEVLSIIRPEEELGIEGIQHLHNVTWHQHDGQLYLLCQSWNPGHYFVLAKV